MKLTAKQTAEKLNISVAQLNTLVENNRLTVINKPTEGKSRVNRYFDSVEVNKLKQENHLPKPRASKETEAPMGNGIISRLDTIESKLDKLIKLWN